MSSDKNVTAQFSEQIVLPPAITRNISFTVVGGGNITSRDGGLNCLSDNSGTCSMDYTEGRFITLDANADPGQQIMQWGGDCSQGESLTSMFMQMDRDLQCSVTFTGNSIGEYLLCTPVSNETGSAVAGTVARSIAGRDNGLLLNCSYYPYGTGVTLTPQANPGYGFLRWSGPATCYDLLNRFADVNQAVIDVELKVDHSCSAIFRDDVNHLGVSGDFSGQQNITSVLPDGLGGFTRYGHHNCFEDCIEPVVGSNTYGRVIYLQSSAPAVFTGCDSVINDQNGFNRVCQVVFQQQAGERRDVSITFF